MSSLNSRRRTSFLLSASDAKVQPLIMGTNPNNTIVDTTIIEDVIPEQDIHAENLMRICAKTSITEELKYYILNSVPLITTFLLQYSLSLSSLFIVGNLCTIKEFSSLSLAIMFYNITGLSPIEGIATCLDSYCSASYTSGNLKYVGVFTVRCYLLILCMFIPIFVSWYTTGFWMQYILPEQHYDLIPNIATFLKIIAFGMPALTLFETGKRFVQAQGFYEITTWSLIFIFPINLFLIYFLTLKLGFIGAPIAMAISHWLMGTSLVFYCLKIRPETLKCWMSLNVKVPLKQEIMVDDQALLHKSHPSYDSIVAEDKLVSPFFQNWWTMLQLALPGLLMILSEYLSFEILTIFTTFLGDEELIAIQTVLASLGTLMYQDLFGLGVVISTRIGQFIGSAYLNSEPPLINQEEETISEKKSIDNAIVSIKAGHFIAVTIGFMNFLILSVPALSKPLISLFTTDPYVIEGSVKIMWIIGLNQLTDGFSVLYASILRAQGRQKIGGLLNIIAYYFIGLPLAFYLSFGEEQNVSWGMGLGLKGLWFGCGSGILFLAISQGLFIYFGDWIDVLRSSYNRLE